MPAGAGKTVPGFSRPAAPSEAKPRAAGTTPSRSSSFAVEPGIAGCARIASCRTTSAVTYRMVPLRSAVSDLSNGFSLAK